MFNEWRSTAIANFSPFYEYHTKVVNGLNLSYDYRTRQSEFIGKLYGIASRKQEENAKLQEENAKLQEENAQFTGANVCGVTATSSRQHPQHMDLAATPYTTPNLQPHTPPSFFQIVGGRIISRIFYSFPFPWKENQNSSPTIRHLYLKTSPPTRPYRPEHVSF